MDSDSDSRKSVIEIAVEEIVTHDGIPCFCAWDRWFEDDPPIRPKWSIQIYDTTPDSQNKDYLRQLVSDFHEETGMRSGSDLDCRDRIDLYGLALPADTPEDARVLACMAHHMAELKARKLSGKADFYIPFNNNPLGWRHGIIILNVSQPWDEKEDGWLFVFFDALPGSQDDDGISASSERPPDKIVRHFTGKDLEQKINEKLQYLINWFNVNYADHGGPEKEVAEYKRRHDLGENPSLYDMVDLRELRNTEDPESLKRVT